jgi:hypothetical protein
MPEHVDNPIRSIPNWVATVGGVVGLVSVFFPITTAFFLAHPLWGWAGLAAVVAVLPATLAVLVNRKLALAKTNWERHHRGEMAALDRSHRDTEGVLARRVEALSRESRAKDIGLLEQRISDCSHSSRFFRFLVEDVDHDHLPVWFSDALDNMAETWDRDARIIEDPHINRVWRLLCDSATSYADNINFYMQEKDRRPDALEIPVDGESGADEHYKIVLTKLQKSRADFEKALRPVHSLVHSG